MPIILNFGEAMRRFASAVALADSNEQLPDEWLERTRTVARSPSKTFVAMLGTALLAKATNPDVDACALKSSDSERAYSARSLCKDVLVPNAVRHRVHLGTTGREPLNNMPFFRYTRVSPDMAVRPAVRPHLDFLCESLARANELTEDEAVRALAAFVRARRREAALFQPEVGENLLPLPELIAATTRFVTSDPEGGKRGQALVAAVLDLVFPDVQTSRVNDPSVRRPGDIVALRDGSLVTAVEVKQRPATDTELIQFAARLPRFGVRRGLIALLSPSQPPLEVDSVRAIAWQSYGVHLSLLEGVEGLLHGALAWTPHTLEEFLEDFPERMALRLQELEVSLASLESWLDLFR